LLDTDGAEKLAGFLAFKSRKHVNFVATLTGAVMCADRLDRLRQDMEVFASMF